MILVQDQYRQGNRRNFESKVQLKQDTPKQVSDPNEIYKLNCCWKQNFPREIWGVSCEEELLTSGNDTDEDEDEEDDEDFQEYPEDVADARHPGPDTWKKTSKNVRFDGPNFNYVLDNYEDGLLDHEPGDVGCDYEDHRRSVSQEPMKVREHVRLSQRAKWRPPDCYGKGKFEKRPKSSPEKATSYMESVVERHRLSKKGPRCGCSHRSVDTNRMYGEGLGHKFEYGDEYGRPRHGDCCDLYGAGEARKLNYLKPKVLHKHACHVKDLLDETTTKGYKKSYRDSGSLHDKSFDSFAYHTMGDHYCKPDDYCDHGKTKKKFLEAVQEQKDQLSDSTYKVPCSKFSSQTMPEELIGLKGMRQSEKMANSSQSDWLCWDRKNFGEKTVQPHRLHKLRSRRTRMNRLKNGWKKAFVQTVTDGSRNERVGIIVMGSKGPEFYTKNSKTQDPNETDSKPPEPGGRSYEVMTVDCKNVYLSSSDPRTAAAAAVASTYSGNDLACPEDDVQVDEKLANFSKNVSEIVKTSEEKFYKALSTNNPNNAANSNNNQNQNHSGVSDRNKTLNDVYRNEEDDGVENGLRENSDKNVDAINEDQCGQTFHCLHLETSSPRVPTFMRKRERKINEESKTMADALNKQAKDFKDNPLSLKEKEETFLESLKQLQEKFPPKQISEETARANMSLWGMKLDDRLESQDCDDDKQDLENGNESNVDEKREKPGDTADTPNTSKMPQSRPHSQDTKRLEDHCSGDAVTVNQVRTEPTSKPLPPPWGSANGDGVDNQPGSRDNNRILIPEIFRDLFENGRAISKEESENLQNLFCRMTYSGKAGSNDAISELSNEVMNTLNESKDHPSAPSSIVETKPKEKSHGKKQTEFGREDKHKRRTDKKHNVGGGDESESYLEELYLKKMLKQKSHGDDKVFKKPQTKVKSRKKMALEDRMKLLREALPSITAENEAAHLKQLKKYIDRFIERVEASTLSECQKRNQSRYRSKDSVSTNSSEVRVDARKILDIVNNPYKTISSDVTINIAKKLTDALVQEKMSKGPRNHSSKAHKNSDLDTDDDRFSHCGATSGSDRGEESEPTYLKQLKKMRGEHLNNIVLEVRRLNELLRFLDRCNRLTF